ncbi:MAG: M42 family metallopeptidase [Candidatus Krumholzibacteriota bacterium]|nr:M42 family metallopeptidase [Candidatus Krumholzibacteriota bacterium]
MSINLPLLKELCETPGAPGREERIREVVIRELKGLCDEVRVDAIGNVIGVKKGSAGGRFMIAGHMDEIGFMVSHIGKNGFLHFVTLGGFDPKTLTAQRVIVHGREDLVGVMGSKPIHIMTDEEKKKPLKVEDFYIDVGLPEEKVKELVRVGDVVTRERSIIEMGEAINGKSMDDRVGVFVMIEALRQAGSGKMDVYAVASVQEEVGLRGAQVATQNVDPDVGVALDVTLANDVPFTQPHQYITELGKGTAIKAFDASVIPNHKLVDFMRETCEARNIPWQLEVLPKGGTDTAAMQRFGKGSAAGCISVPVRYVHSVIETLHPGDVQASIDLLAALIQECTPDQFAL